MLWRKWPERVAKVGVEGSNPFARSRFPQGNQAARTVLRGRFLLPPCARKPGKQKVSSGGRQGHGAWPTSEHWWACADVRLEFPKALSITAHVLAQKLAADPAFRPGHRKRHICRSRRAPVRPRLYAMAV